MSFEFGERISGSAYRLSISQRCGIAVSFERGNIATPNIFPPFSGPTTLYNSHNTATSAIDTKNIPVR
jgi:hypothetical protein